MRARWMAAFVLVALGVIAYLVIRGHGAEAPRAELKAARAEVEALTDTVEAVATSNEISRDTAARVDQAGAETRQQATEARERILERVEADPVPAGAADPVVMHEASEAYAAAVRATCRVQRAHDCPAPAAPTD